MSISSTTIKHLYAKSGNRCAFPGCDVLLTYSDHNSSNMAHIISQRINGPRHDPNYNNGNYDAEENIMLLCNNHHTLVDSCCEQYTVEELRNMKYSHENYIESLLNSGDINKRIIQKFLTIIHQHEVIMTIENNDFISPVRFWCIEHLSYCLMEIYNQILNSVDIISCNKKVVNDIRKFHGLLDELIVYLPDK